MSGFTRGPAPIAAILTFSSILAACSSAPTTEAEVVFSSTFEADPSSEADFLVDFGNVVIGVRKEEWIDVANGGDSTLEVSAEKLAKPFGHDIPAAGLQIDAGSASKIRFDFEPGQQTDEPLQRIIELRTNENGGRTYRVRLLGRGIRASLDCEPSSLDFGQLPKGSSRSITTVCTNQLSAPIELMVDWFSRFTGDLQNSFSSKVDGAVDGWVELDSGASTSIQVTFTPRALGASGAVLEIGNPAVQPLAAVQVAGEGVVSALRVETDGCLDFGEVAPGESATRTLTLRNVDTRPVSIESISISGEDFGVASQLPFDLAEDGATRDVEVVFHPTRIGPLQASIGFQTVSPRLEGKTVTACINGYGGGASVHCSSGSIDFSMVAVGLSARASYRCINDGQELKESPVAPLVIDGLVSTSPEFSAKIVNEDKTEGPRRTGYRVGESFEIEVLYSPTKTGRDAGEIRLQTAAVSGGFLATSVTGQGRELPPCDFDLEPGLLPFGVLDRGASLTRTFGIRNNLDTSCIIRDLRLSAESAEAFSVSPIYSVELLGHEVLEIPVTFSPIAYADLVLGSVEFEISNADGTRQTVELTGTSAIPCIRIEPEVVDFGTVSPGCQSRERRVRISNRCDARLTVQSVAVNQIANMGSLQIKESPTLPRTLNPIEALELSMLFLPIEEGSFKGTLAVEVEGSGPYYFGLLGEAAPDPIQTDTFESTGTKVDVLWVMDNSGSFDPYQDRIAQSLPSFLTTANEMQVDYQIAVTTSGLTKSGTTCPGGANGGEDGRFYPIDGSHPRILTPTTPDIETHWAFNMKVGTCHGTEQYLEAAYRALSPPLVNESKSSKHYGETSYYDGNAGFLRSEAFLSIVFVADEPDQSTAFGKTLPDYLNFFKVLKGDGRLKIHAISGSKPTEPSSCNLRNGERFRYLIDETGGTWLDICTPVNDVEAWNKGIKRISESAFGFPTSFVLRGDPADRSGDGFVTEDDLDLFVDGDRLPPVSESQQRRWRYDPVSNVIEFHPLSFPASSAKVTATYRVACSVP